MKRITLSILVVAMVSAVLSVMPAAANTNYNLSVHYEAEDCIWNYDFCDDGYEGQPNHVDQPVTIIFWGNANKSAVSDFYWLDQFYYGGSYMYNRLDDGSGWVDNDDNGKKNDFTDMNGYHYRLYAANNYAMWNRYWLNYVVSTTHRDYLFNGGYGWSEDCENYLCSLAQNRGLSVWPDAVYFANADSGRWDGTQYWQSDGWASQIEMP